MRGGARMKERRTGHCPIPTMYCIYIINIYIKMHHSLVDIINDVPTKNSLNFLLLPFNF